MIAALRRVLAAPGYIAALWLAAVLSAAIVGEGVTAAVAELGIGPAPDGHALFTLLHLLATHADLGSMTGLLLVLTAIVGYVGWTLLSPLLILRLEGVRAAAELGYGWLGSLGPVVVQTLWHLLLRALGLVVLGVSVGPLGAPWNLLVLALGWVTANLALDLTRIGVVRHGARRWHPSTAAFAFLRAVQDARCWGAVAVTWLLQVASVGAILHMATYGVGPGAMSWASRGIALVGILAGLWRLAVAIERSPVRLRGQADS